MLGIFGKKKSPADFALQSASIDNENYGGSGFLQAFLF